jgi:hypothetical protein
LDAALRNAEYEKKRRLEMGEKLSKLKTSEEENRQKIENMQKQLANLKSEMVTLRKSATTSKLKTIDIEVPTKQADTLDDQRPEAKAKKTEKSNIKENLNKMSEKKKTFAEILGISFPSQAIPPSKIPRKYVGLVNIRVPCNKTKVKDLALKFQSASIDTNKIAYMQFISKSILEVFVHDGYSKEFVKIFTENNIKVTVYDDLAPFKDSNILPERKGIIQRRMIQTFQFISAKSTNEQLKKTSVFPKLMAFRAHLCKSYQILFNRFLNKDVDLLVGSSNLNPLEQSAMIVDSSSINQSNSSIEFNLI